MPIAQYLRPGSVLLDVPGDPADPYHAIGQDNLARLHAAHDSAGRALEVLAFDAGTPAVTAYMNHYLVNGGVMVPADGYPNDEGVLVQLKRGVSRTRDRHLPGASSWRVAAGRTASRSRCRKAHPLPLPSD